jgi:hypothetical protein
MHLPFLDAQGEGKSQRTAQQLFSKNITVPVPFSALLSPKSTMHPTDASDFNPGSMTSAQPGIETHHWSSVKTTIPL